MINEMFSFVADFTLTVLESSELMPVFLVAFMFVILIGGIVAFIKGG